MDARELDAYNNGFSNGRTDCGLERKSEYAYLHESADGPDVSDSGVRWRFWYTEGYRDGYDGRERRRP